MKEIDYNTYLWLIKESKMNTIITLDLTRRDVICLIKGYTLSYKLMEKYSAWGGINMMGDFMWNVFKLLKAEDIQLTIILDDLRKQFEYENGETMEVITCILSKKDVCTFIQGFSPSWNGKDLFKEYGTFSDQFGWKWNRSSLLKLDLTKLQEILEILKKDNFND